MAKKITDSIGSPNQDEKLKPVGSCPKRDYIKQMHKGEVQISWKLWQGYAHTGVVSLAAWFCWETLASRRIQGGGNTGNALTCDARVGLKSGFFIRYFTHISIPMLAVYLLIYLHYKKSWIKQPGIFGWKSPY
ncbi:hypothetical protein C5167_026464 [Papaver somniferum]|nr:hypothetical protein C5167_026464 [Papaver somniferum]